MDLINKFKKKLIENDTTTGKVTLKNYASDIKKFVLWFETTYQRSFPPQVLPREIIDAYLNPIRNASPRSSKRYESSLRKFCSYLLDQGIITYNPLATGAKSKKEADPWHLKEFNNFLYTSNASRLTIKNYILDIRQFLNWVKEVSNDTDVFAKIDTFLLEEYKNRLLSEAKLSPLSVNRKLSSLRKYINWAVDKGIMMDKAEVGSILLQTIKENQEEQLEPKSPEEQVAELRDLSITSSAPAKSGKDKLSSFPPLRLLQKSKNALGFLFDTLVILSIFKTIEAIKYNLWKSTGKQVFTPLSEMALAGADLAGQGEAKLLSPKHLTVVDQFITMGEKATIGRFRSIPKSVYAPLKISTTDLPLWKKIKHYFQYVRPKWYKIYHSYPFVHYLHFAIVLIFATFAGFKIYQAVSVPPPQKIVLGSQAPKRLLSFQGQLNDDSGTPITQQTRVGFAIYNNQTATGSAILWQEKQTVSPDQNGNFSTSLGKNTPLAQEIFSNNPNLYLGISIGNTAELIPRLELANFGLAKDAERLQGLKPITGNNAGTSNVILALDSSGNLTIGGASTPVFQATGGEFRLSGQQLTLATNEGSNTNVVLNPDGTGIIDLQRPLQNTSNNNNLISALGAVEVDDNFAILATSSAQSALIINQNSTGDLISAQNLGIAKFTVDSRGSGMFAHDLSILGNNLSTATGTFNIANTNTTTLNIGGAATAISLGASTGTTTINHDLRVAGKLSLPALTSGGVLFINSDKQLTQDIGNFFWDQNSKRLGIGTPTPNFRLDVQDSHDTNAAASILNSSTSTNSVALQLKLGVTTAPQASNRWLNFVDGNGQVLGKVRGNNTSNTVTFDSNGGDFAEYFPKANPQELFGPGDLICYSTSTGVEKCNSNSNGIVGIFSDDAGFVGAGGHDNDPRYVLVGLIGQLKVKIGSSGAIKPGDPITSSAETGMGTKATRAGQIIGRALESYDPSTPSNKLIKISLNASWYDPKAILEDNGDISTTTPTDSSQNTTQSNQIAENVVLSTQEFLSTLKIGLLEVQKISVDSLSVATDDVTIGGLALRDYIASIVNDIVDKRLAENKNTITIVSPIASVIETESNSASLSANPTPQPAISLTASPSANIINITNIYNTASVSAVIASPSGSTTPNPTPTIQPEAEASTSADLSPTPTPLNPTPIVSPSASEEAILDTDYKIQNTDPANIATFSAELSYIPNFKSDFATFNQGLIALGPTSLSETSISTHLSIGSNLQISENSINTLGSELNLQPLRQGNLSIMGGLLSIDTSGNLMVEGNATFTKNVEVKGTLATGVISPLAGSDSKIEIKGDITSSGSAQFANFKIVRSAQADTSFTETIASGSAGTAVITANHTERTIVTPFVNKNSLIYISPASSTEGSSPYIARQTLEDPNTQSKGSFTIQISSPVTADIKLNWWIIN